VLTAVWRRSLRDLKAKVENATVGSRWRGPRGTRGAPSR
jgi:hypothetical protein